MSPLGCQLRALSAESGGNRSAERAFDVSAVGTGTQKRRRRSVHAMPLPLTLRELPFFPFIIFASIYLTRAKASVCVRLSDQMKMPPLPPSLASSFASRSRAGWLVHFSAEHHLSPRRFHVNYFSSSGEYVFVSSLASLASFIGNCLRRERLAF